MGTEGVSAAVTRRRLIHSARQLLTITGPGLGLIPDGAVLVEQGKVIWVGPTREIPREMWSNAECYDAAGAVVMPGFVDCHTHLIFAGWREAEFEQRLQGRSYKEISLAGGGIMSTVRATRQAAEEELYRTARKRLQELLSWGTTTVEIKSGYGLNTADELKILRVIRRLTADPEVPLTIVSTFLGAHSIPPEQSRESYVQLLIDEMIPAVAREGLAEFCDVFCEDFVFDTQESRRILLAAREHGLLPKIHADEIHSSGGAELAAEVNAVSAEHLLVPSAAGLQAMKAAGVVAVLLPGTAFFLNAGRTIPPVARMREIGLTIALGTDFNPGTCTIYAMPIIISLACLIYRLTPEEAIIAATRNAAQALKLDGRKGVLKPGSDADILILNISDFRQLPYRFGHNPVQRVMLGGEWFQPRSAPDDGR